MLLSGAEKHRSFWAMVIMLVLTLAAAHLRLSDLGALGFYGDEETTAFPAKSLAEGHGLSMPSGLPYFRAIPQTILNALSASLIGTEEELSYRLPASLIGVLTIPLFLLMSRGLVPPFLAITAALLLVFSDWHIITSREARMYTPFMLCFLSTGLLFVRWADNLDFRRIAIIAVLAALTLLLHTLGLLLVLFPLAWLVIRGERYSRWGHVLTFIAFVAIFYFVVNRGIIARAFLEWPATVGQSPSAGQSQAKTGGILEPILESFPWIVLGLLGVLLGAWLGRCLVVADQRNRPWIVKFGAVSLSIAFAFFLLSANFYAAGIAGISLLLVQPVRTLGHLSRCKWPLILLASSGIAVILYVLATTESVADLKDHLRFPFPYFAYFWEYSPGLMVLFWTGVVASTFPARRECELNIRIFSLVAIGTIAGLGVVSEWGGMRYLIGAYPFVLLVAGYPLYRVQAYLRDRSQLAGQLGSGVIIGCILIGAVQGHSLQSAIEARDISYGPSDRALTLGFDIYPDHKGAAQYVDQHAVGQDIVIVEDALQQYWYTGRELLWLSDDIANSKFMYVDSEGVLRDVYVNSKVLRSAEIFDVCTIHSGAAWVVTSAESEDRRHLSLSNAQREWLEGVMRNLEPVFVARDKTTSVYRVPCYPPG
ncbi:MAG: glycosyltransferase family 39 protein [Gammaproteobacteria bacterium]|nr:glycosyltransferase family 39 protein [Gammaproteobacteria bacterium]NNL51722.1 hypothetical protein [Woeseiaceae bacterium]